MSIQRDHLRGRLDTIESSYEFMLAYAAQGLRSDAASRDGGRIRGELGGLAAALDGLGPAFDAALGGEGPARSEHQAFHRVLEDDAARALAAVRLVLAQPSISSQLVDNLNASLHLRALLTDVFLVDEILDVLGSSIAAAGTGTEPD
jgi:hypothetical protein